MIQIIPTDTCYGLAGDMSEADYREIYRLKGRDFSKRLAVLVQDFDSLRNYAVINDEQINLLRNYSHAWSIILKKNPQWVLPDFLNAVDYENISFRIAEICIPANIRNVLQFPLFLTSANISGEKESITLQDAIKSFSDTPGYDDGICNLPPSDVFSFGDNNEFIYLRKNS